jgi:hypothetical protein
MPARLRIEFLHQIIFANSAAADARSAAPQFAAFGDE